MDSTTIDFLNWLLAISSAMMAGVYLAFSSFIMRAFAALGPARAIAAMNAVNTVILKSAFMALFFGSCAVALLMVATGLWSWSTPGAGRAVASGAIYLVGMFGVTALANVPLNNALAAVSGDSEAAVRTWDDYLRRWTRWNTLRTVASVLTAALCIGLPGL